jgi:uncharacterized protein YhjY with autotransporter beta-barrel domain
MMPAGLIDMDKLRSLLAMLVLACLFVFPLKLQAATAVNDVYSFTADSPTPYRLDVISDNDVLDSLFTPPVLELGVVFSGDPSWITVNTLGGDGLPVFDITPSAGFTGLIEFNYKLTDSVSSSEALVSLEVLPGGALKLVDDTYYIKSGDPSLTFNVSFNDILPVDSSYSYTEVSASLSGLNGSLSNDDSSGTFTFVPTPGSSGLSTFEYLVDVVSGQVATVNIYVDEPSSPKTVIDFVSRSGSVVEGGGLVIELSRTGSMLADIPVTIVPNVESSASAADYGLNPVSFVWLGSGSSTRTLLFTALDDTAFEGTEYVTLDFAALPAGVESFSPYMDIQIIDTDEDPAGPEGVQFRSSTYEITEGELARVIEVERTGAGIGVQYAYVNVNPDPTTATEFEDYEIPGGVESSSIELVWEDGEIGRKAIRFKAQDDGIEDDGEVVVLQLYAPIPASESSFDDTTVVTLRDAKPDVVGLLSDIYTVNEADGKVTIGFSRSGTAVGVASLKVALVPERSTASDGSDFIFGSEPKTITWAYGESGKKSLSFDLVDDGIYEEKESLTLLIESVENAEASAISETVVHIIDSSVTDTVSFDVSSSVVNEGDSLSFDVLRSGEGNGPASATIRFGSSALDAVLGDDFALAPGSSLTLNWADKEVGVKTVVIDVLTDSVEDAGEYIRATLSDISNMDIGASSTAKVLISDGKDQVSFVSGEYQLTEGGAELLVELQRTGLGFGEATVVLGFDEESGTSVSDDLVFKGGESSASLTWAEGETGIKTVVLQALSDDVLNEEEVFVLSMLSVSNFITGDSASASITIKEASDLALDTVAFTQSRYRGSEEGGQSVIKLSRNGSGSGAVEVELNIGVDVAEAGSLSLASVESSALSLSPATAGEDYVAETRLIRWEDGETGIKTIKATILPDLGEPDPDGEYFTLELTGIISGDARLGEKVKAEVVIYEQELLGNLVAENSKVKRVADALDAICSVDTSSGSDVPVDTSIVDECAELASLDASQVEEALDKMLPKSVEAQIESAVELAGNQLQNLRRRLKELRGGNNRVSVSGLNMSLFDENVPLMAAMQSLLNDATGGSASADDGLLDSRWGVFVNGTISLGDQDDSDDSLGYSVKSKGLTAGLDYRFNPKMVIGGAIGIGQSDNDFNQQAGRQDTDSLTVSVFGNHFVNNKIYADWIVSYTQNDFEIERHFELFGRSHDIKASPEGSQLTMAVGGGYDYVRGAIQLTGFGRIDYIKTSIKRYQESGSIYALELGTQSDTSIETALGGRAAYVYSFKGGILIPSMELEWVHQFAEDERRINASFVESPTSESFSVVTEGSDTDYLNGALSVSATFSGGKSAYFRYDTLLNDSSLSRESYTLGGRYEF